MLICDFNDLGNKLHKLRKRLGMTQADVAEAAGLSDRTYADIERGSVNMRVETLLKICSALHTTPDELFTSQKEEMQVDQVINRLNSCTAREKETAINLLNTYLDSLKD